MSTAISNKEAAHLMVSTGLQAGHHDVEKDTVLKLMKAERTFTETHVSYSDLMHSVFDCFNLDSLLNISYYVILSAEGGSNLHRMLNS